MIIVRQCGMTVVGRSVTPDKSLVCRSFSVGRGNYRGSFDINYFTRPIG